MKIRFDKFVLLSTLNLLLVISCGETNKAGNLSSASCTATTVTYGCGQSSLDQTSLVETQLALGPTLNNHCGPNTITSICSGAVDPKVPPKLDTNPITTNKKPDICDATEFSTASYFCNNVFKSYGKEKFITNETVSFIENDIADEIDLGKNSVSCNFLNICSIPLDLQYFTVTKPDQIWVSIRGSVFKKGSDNDFSNAAIDTYTALSKVTVPTIKNGVSNIKGGESIFMNSPSLKDVKFHSGFLGSAEVLVQQLTTGSNAISKSTPIKITGHSLGAGIAIIAALMLLDQGYNVTALYDFGQPTVTDQAGAATIQTYLEGVSKFQYIRFIQGLDPIPFGFWGVNNDYAHFGPEVRLGLGSSICTSGIGQPGCYTPAQLSHQTSFAYLASGTLGYPGVTVINAGTEHKMAIYLYRLEQLGCSSFSTLKEFLTGSCEPIVSADPESPDPSSCVPTLKCQ